MSKYPETPASPNFAEIEKKNLKFWQENKIFEKSVSNLKSKKDGGEEFSFFDGPPFANGLPHYGHLLTSSVKDIYARYQTMKGKRTERVFGWDCHGLPAEMEAEKQLGIQGQLAILDYGIEKFNDTCRTSVMRYTQEWQDYVNRLGRWVDFENGYKTMDRNYMESVIWAFSELHKKGLVYQGHKVMPYSWACETPLSNFETRMDNAYREKVSKSLVVAFELDGVNDNIVEQIRKLRLTEVGEEIRKHDHHKFYICAWTTTPWTLPSNCALAISQDVNYTLIFKDGNFYITSKNFVRTNGDYLTKEGFLIELDESLSAIKGADLLGNKYKPLFPYFADDARVGANGFTILEGDFVSDADGTGIVHLAPGFGEDDQRVCEAAGICTHDNGGIICPVDEAGKYTAEIFDIDGISLKGLNVMKDIRKSDSEPYKDEQLEKYGLANLRVTAYLKEKGQLIEQKDYVHNYPHCWRTDTPLIYKAVPSWYVKVTAFKDRMVELNKDINWTPEHIRDGQFGKWLENAHDWAISRNRFWGAPIPVWKTESGKMKVFGSIKELEDFFGVEVTDLHRPFIDNLTKVDPENPKETYKRVNEVLDCWFESGSMPFAELHYPFENQDKFKARFPADFIVEYVAQTRGWFYTLMVLSTALFDSIPFKNCICHGVILGEPSKNPETGKMEKQKLSKRLKNYPDPVGVFDTLGADAMRFMMIASPVMNGGELTISKNGDDIKEVVRLILKPIWNAYHFFTLYANSDKITAQLDFTSENIMDRFIIAKLKIAVEAIDKNLTSYDTQSACKALEDFFEVMNNWYIRRSRERFWRKADASDTDKQGAYNTLYTCLVTISKAAAPLLPYLFEEIYKNLTGGESVHLEQFPSVPANNFDASVMDKIRDICNTGLSIRNKENIRVRQPLASITICGNQEDVNAIVNVRELYSIIQEELNVEGTRSEVKLEEKAELKLKINFPTLGKRLPEKIKEIIPASKQGKWTKTSDGRVEICGEILEKEECDLLLEPKNPKGAAALSTNDAIVILDLNITPELKQKGIARDVIRAIQQARKDADLNISDRINVAINASGEVASAISANENFIAGQTLSKSIEVSDKKFAKYNGKVAVEESEIELSFEVA